MQNTIGQLARKLAIKKPSIEGFNDILRNKNRLGF